VLTTLTVASLLCFYANGQHCPSNSISSSYRNTWKVESLMFTRRGNDSSPPESVAVDFRLHHPKYDRVENCANRTVDGYLDTEICLDGKDGLKPIQCNTRNINTKNRYDIIPTPDTLWRPCTGRITSGPTFSDLPKCKNITMADVLNENFGSCYEGHYDVEDKSDRPWAKWRVLKLDEPANPTRNDSSASATMKPFRTITLEVVTAQR
jgi:hypothetical protein